MSKIVKFVYLDPEWGESECSDGLNLLTLVIMTSSHLWVLQPLRMRFGASIDVESAVHGLSFRVGREDCSDWWDLFSPVLLMVP